MVFAFSVAHRWVCSTIFGGLNALLTSSRHWFSFRGDQFQRVISPNQMVPASLRTPNWITIMLTNHAWDKAAKFPLPHIRILCRGECEDKNQGWFTTPSWQAASIRLPSIVALSVRPRLTTERVRNRSSGFTVDKFTNWQSSLRGNRSNRSPEMSGMRRAVLLSCVDSTGSSALLEAQLQFRLVFKQSGKVWPRPTATGTTDWTGTV